MRNSEQLAQARRSNGAWRERNREKLREDGRRYYAEVAKPKREADPVRREKELERARNYRESPEGRRKRFEEQIWRKYKIAVEDWAHLYNAQGGTCAVCRKVSELHVDHDHTSGSVRGLLCRTCNIALGFIEKNPTRTHKLLDYLGAHR